MAFHDVVSRAARLFFCTALSLLSAFVSRDAAGQPAPADLKVAAYAGAVSPGGETRFVAVDSTGNGTYCLTLPPDRATAVCSSTSPVALTSTHLDSIWAAVQTNGFFGLDSTYADSLAEGGTFAELTITGGGMTHFVVTQNINVPAFDAIITALNAVLPAANRILYNGVNP